MINNNRGGVFMKVLIWVELIFLFAYIIFNLYMFWHRGLEPSTLTVSVFALFTGDFIAKAWIRSSKAKAEGTEEVTHEHYYNEPPIQDSVFTSGQTENNGQSYYTPQRRKRR